MVLDKKKKKKKRAQSQVKVDGFIFIIFALIFLLLIYCFFSLFCLGDWVGNKEISLCEFLIVN